DGLRLLATRQHLAHALLGDARAVFEFQRRGEEVFAGRRRHDVAVAVLIVAGGPPPLIAARIADIDAAHARPGLAAERAGIHEQRAAERAGNAGEEFRGRQSPLDALAREPRAGHAGFAGDGGVVDPFETRE